MLSSEELGADSRRPGSYMLVSDEGAALEGPPSEGFPACFSL